MVVFLLSDVRSGSNMLASCFRNDVKFRDFGEIFYSSSDGTSDYMAFVETEKGRTIDVFENYIAELSSFPGVSWVDIKLHDLSRFNPLQIMLGGEPTLLRFIRESGHKVVLLGRRNFLRASISSIQARLTGIFHARGDFKNSYLEEGPNKSLTLEALEDALMRERSFVTVSDFLRSRPNLFYVDYEAFLTESGPDRAIGMLGQWLGLDVFSFPETVHLNPDIPAWFDVEIASDILNGTHGYWWLK